jgi:uncharacterized protein (TIGR03118 family)
MPPRVTTRDLRVPMFVLAYCSLFVFLPSAAAQYVAKNLVADTPTLHARHLDPNLFDAWGIAFSPDGPIWVNNQNSSTSTIYNSEGKTIPLVVEVPCIVSATVTVPCPLPSQGARFPFAFFGPTGLTTNQFASMGDFPISQNGTMAPALFIFDTLDGLVLGWNPAVNETQAVVAANNSAIAAYTGLAIAGPAANPHIYAANLFGQIDVFDKNFNLVNSFAADSDPDIPLPYGVSTIGTKLYVTYIPVPPLTGGILDVCDLSKSNTNPTCQRLLASGPSSTGSGLVLSAPWGVTLAPPDFGVLSNDLLVGNIFDGRINALDPDTGAFIGPLLLTNGKPFVALGLWDLEFGGGIPSVNGHTNQLFFSAGPGPTAPTDFSEGLLGVIEPAPPK